MNFRRILGIQGNETDACGVLSRISHKDIGCVRLYKQLRIIRAMGRKTKTASIAADCFCGADGTRTRDLRRDRPVF